MTGGTSASKPFLRRGEGRLGTSVPTTGGRPGAGKRTLQLKHPALAGAHSLNASAEDEPRSYSEMHHARQMAPKPTSAPASPDRGKGADRGRSALARGSGEREAMVLASMDDGVLGRGHSRSRSRSRDTSTFSVPARRTADTARPSAAPKNSRMMSSSPSRSRTVRTYDKEVLTDIDRGVARKRMEGWYADTPSEAVLEVTHHKPAAAVDFSPVLQALQAKLASLTQENIGLRESVRELEEAMGTVEEHYKERLREAVESVSVGKRDEVRSAVASLRVRERQEQALRKHLSNDKNHEEVQRLSRELRAQKQEAVATEGVLQMALDRLKKDKLELQERLKAIAEDPQHQCTACGLLRGRCAELERELARLKQAKVDISKMDRGAKKSLQQQARSALPQAAHDAQAAAARPRSVDQSPARHVVGQPQVRGRLSGQVPSHRSAGSSRSRSPARQAFASPSLDEEPRFDDEVPQPSPPRMQFRAEDTPRTSDHAVASESNSAYSTPGKRLRSELSTEHSSPGMQPRTSPQQRTLPNGAVETANPDGARTITFKDGTVKELTTDGRLVVRFANGDVKEECKDGTITYFYREARTTHITYKSGLQLLHFPDNQMEKHYPDGSREVLFPDKTRRRFRPDGTEDFDAWV